MEKNIFLLPTDKSSRLYLEYGDGDLCLANNLLPQTSRSNNQNVHITSDEKIKQYDWCLNTKTKNIFQATFTDVNSIYAINPSCKYEDSDKVKKIILTTDQSLKGVQSIDNQFLNWFVKNTNCEQIKIDSEIKCFDKNGFSISSCIYDTDYSKMVYIPIIPLDADFLGRTSFDLLKQEAIKEEMAEFDEQQTLEQDAKKYAVNKRNKKNLTNREFDLCQKDFIEGAKHQAERSFSKEEVIELLQKYRFDLSSGKTAIIGDTTNFWFDQFKKNKLWKI
jgi:hypothetical protein